MADAQQMRRTFLLGNRTKGARAKACGALLLSGARRQTAKVTTA